MSTKFLKILQLTTVGISFLVTSEYAYSDNKILCIKENWSYIPKCGHGIAARHKPDDKWSVRWAEGNNCETIGALTPVETDFSRNDIVEFPECKL